MSASSYDAALARVLAHEGGYTHDPSDSGGPTNFGITIADYRRYAKPGATAADVKAMTVDEAKVIYRAHYWDALACDSLPAGVDYAVFDYGVNSGTSRAAKALQRLASVADDGVIGPVTLAAVVSRDPAGLVAAICDERLAFLQSLKTWPVFGKGWSRRVADVKSTGIQMAKAAPAPGPAASGKAVAASAVLVVTATAAAAPVAGSALWDFMGGKTMLAMWTLALALIAVGLLYFFVVRPVLRAAPSWTAFYRQAEDVEHSLWARFTGILIGLRTVIAARLVTLCGLIVGIHDFILPYVAGVDWAPFTARVPAWSVPLLIVATGALFEWLRRLTTGSVARGV